MGSASRAELFFAAYGRVEWRDKLWKLLQNLARLVAWAAWERRGVSGNAGEADLGDVAANLARGISTSRKGFRMGKWLLPLGRLVVDLRFFVRNGMDVSFREGVCKRLAKMLARGFMAGYGVWDNLVFLSSIGTLGGRSQTKAFKITSHKFRLFGNVLMPL